MRTSIVAAVVALEAIAVAQPDAPPPQPPPVGTPTQESPGSEVPTPTEVAPPTEVPTTAYLTPPPADDSPLPGDESGRIDDIDPGDSEGRRFARFVLYLPRAFVTTLLTPFRVAVWAESKYHISANWHRIFYNDADTFGIYPSLAFESGYGFRLGANLVARPTVRDCINAFVGGSFSLDRERLAFAYDALDRGDGDLTLSVGAEYERRPNDHFYGLGNNNAIADTPMPIALGVDDVAIDVRYRQRLARVAGSADLNWISDLHTRGAVALSNRLLGPSTHGAPIDQVVDPMTLAGFEESYTYGYAELDLFWDSRRRQRWDAPGLVSGGSLASVWGGRVTMSDFRDFFRYGVDLQQFIRIANGPRVISARFHGEAISIRADEIPFPEVPTIGGPIYLRGYPIERFRDRIAAVGTLEYQWDLSRAVYASLFVDCGRVYDAYDDLSLDDLRTGFGVSLEGHAGDFSGVRVSMASSSDGGLFFNLYFEPVFAVTPRVERR